MSRYGTAIGIMLTILGGLLVLCISPLAINSLVFIASSAGTPISLYGRLFPTRIGHLNLASYVSGAQLITSVVLALLVLAVGIFVLVRARRERA